MYEKERMEVINTGIEMAKTSLVVGTWGNISKRIDDNLIAITPSGMDYYSLKPEDITILNMDGEVVDGERKPSIEYNMHLEIYKNRSEVGAVVHTHSTYCTALAMARKGIPGAAEDLVQITGGDVRVSEYALPGSMELAKNAVKALEGRNAVILANHGALSAGKDLKETLKISLILEKTAKATIYAQLLGGVVPLSQEDIDFMRDFYLNKYGQR
ncbi:class II aldolase/adducin family protein [Anaerosalibacter sp. Marseille-P3206]|uniref:class II aldolase/adducin family protein n=1 Tax=Anaerosalibacter sp. Marseille-P3206 TaxID=1871005 RepID=UPI000987697D|nr:class II aldolase/adducin family protein [Anaerosalibacter sp. Marseille-P3206]